TMLLPLLVLVLPCLLHGASINTPSNPWGDFAPDCQADKPSLWDESRIEKKWYTLDLDKEEHDRWREVANDFTPQMVATLAVVKTTADSFLGEEAWPAFIQLVKGSDDMLTEPYKSEIKALAELTGIPVEELTLLNLFYEISALCTSLVAIDHNGKVFHGRNLDFGLMFMWNVEDHTDDLLQLEFKKGGKLLFKAVTFAGHLGLLTAVRPGAFSVTLNTRFGSSVDTMTKFFTSGLDPDQQFVMYALRDMITNCETFDEAKKYIETEQFLAPAYITMGHSKGGVVVTRSITGADHEAVINTKESNGWYVLQTNYDWDKPDKYLDQRTEPGNKCMQQLGRDRVTKEGIFQVMSSKPNLNKATVYTTVMEIDSGELYTFKQDCKDPCWMLLPRLLLILPSLLLAEVQNTPENPWGEFAPDCQADASSLWDESRTETKWYSIDLDKEDHDRWREVANDFAPQMSAAIAVVKTMADSFLGEETWPALLHLVKSTPDMLTEPYKSEIKAMADLTGIPIEEVSLLNLFYEISNLCTSLVAVDVNGKVFHGRNLDFGLMFIWNIEEHTWELTRTLRDLVVQLEFKK
ncbi:hypothetical protein PMAYCL1PPCAC_27729, partial [Pristionchus mayeri]